MSDAKLPLQNVSRLLGVFPLPVGFLLLPDLGDGRSPLLDRLLIGDTRVPLPEAWAFFSAALQGDAETALDALRASGSDPIRDYNALVLSADPELLERLNSRSDLPAGLAPLIATVSYALGLSDEPPGSTPALSPEASALIGMVRAAHHLELERPDEALAELEEAQGLVREHSPVFAAQLAAQRGEILRGIDLERSVVAWKEALTLAEVSLLPGLRAQFFVQLGLTLHELAGDQRHLLLEAVRAYQEALHAGLDAESGPEAYAMVQAHLGLAYLALPMQDQSAARLRPGIAVQSFRQALEIYRPETHPELWASTQLNLANALQYLPSSHPQENLVQAVELYEQLLGFRNRADDPVGYARLLANQANALAHLGVFQPALEKLEEARRLFHWHGEPDLAESVMEQVATIHEQRQQTVPTNGAADGVAADGG